MSSNYKWAIVGDIHAGVRGDSKIFHSIMVLFFNRLIDTMIERDIKTCIFLGDVFERRKFVNFETLYVFKRQIMDRLRDLGIQTYIIAGNHDVYFKNTNRVNSIDLLIPPEEYPNVHRIVHDAKEFTIDGVPVLFVPWVNRENYDSIRETIDKSSATFMVAHLDMAGFEMHRGTVSERGHFDAEFLDRFSKVLTGHYHTKSSKGNIYYLGTPYETSWNDYGEDKGFHILENGELEFIKNEFSTFHRFIYDDRNKESIQELAKTIKESELSDKFVKIIVRSKKNPKLFEKVIEAIEAKSPVDLNILDESNFVKDGDETDDEISALTDTLSVIQSYILKDLETDLDKQRLYGNMSTLYQQALEMTDGD